jgi:8-oxo-dGTP pyrophosphatase MutT (NUDIX family)
VTLGSILENHPPADDKEAADLRLIRAFVARHRDPFDRRIAEGHLTGAAFVVSDDGARVLLLHHPKLLRWLQPGGHGDPGETTGEEVALREALEETGIEGLRLHPHAPRPLDVDVHPIPARGTDPTHLHLDLRYLVVAPPAAAPRGVEAEATRARWFPWDALPALGLDAGLTRGLAKARAFWPAGG